MTTDVTLKKAARNGAAVPVVRCAIYVRQSVTDPNATCRSVDQQEASIREYITRRRDEGWVALPYVHRDENISGATEDRPGYQALLQDVREHKVDCVVVHAVDRLSRSLASFAALLEMLEDHNVGLVSLTQAFDSRSPMGKLTLGILGSFSAYERSMIITRTRDAMAAGRRRGVYLGGRAKLGYQVVNGRLEVVPEEARQVREIVDLYLKTESILAVVTELRRRGWKTKTYRSQAGRITPGRPYDKVAVRHLLSCPTIAGKTRVDGEYFEAQHAAIIDFETYQRVQNLLSRRSHTGSTHQRSSSAALLGNSLLICAVCGSSMTTQSTKRGSRIYRSYSCSRYVREGAAACPGSRVSLGQIEAFVVERIKAIGRDPALVAATIEAARGRLVAKQSDLEADLARVDAARHYLVAERANLVAAIRTGGPSAKAPLDRLAEVDMQLATNDQQEKALRAEFVAFDGTAVDPADLTAALAQYDDVWSEMPTTERTRVLRLLIDRVTFDGRTGDVAIAFHSKWPAKAPGTHE